MLNSCRVLAIIVCCGCALAAGGNATAADPAEPLPSTLDALPPEWSAVAIDWKPTWEETLAANAEAKWQEEIGKNPALAQVRDIVVRLRRAKLLEELVKRFPQDREKCIKAYEEIGQAYAQIGSQDWRAYWGWKLARDYANDPAAVERGRGLMMGWGFGQYVHWGNYAYWIMPESRRWEFVIRDVAKAATEGRVPADSAAAAQAFNHLLWLEAEALDHAALHASFDKLETLGAKSPALWRTKADMLSHFGHRLQATKLLERAGQADARNQLNGYPDGSITVQKPDFEATTRWETLTTLGSLAAGHTGPVDVVEVQKMLDCVSRQDALLRTDTQHVPFSVVVADRLARLPAAALAPLREAQDGAARLSLERLRDRDDGGAVLRLFRRYPFARCLHEALVEQAERDVVEGRSNWAIPIYAEVLARADDPRLLAEARVGTWLALAGSGAAPEALRAEVGGVPDATMVPWRGGEIAAGTLKQQLMARPAAGQAAPSAAARPLAALPVRRIELPRDWPCREENPDGPIGDFGTRAPWPVSHVELRGKATIAGCPLGVGRFAADTGQPTWVTAAPREALEEAMPWYPGSCRRFATGPQHVWYFDRRPARLIAGDDLDAFHILGHETGRPLVTAYDPRFGGRLWTAGDGEEWKGLVPLGQPALAEGCLYLLAGPSEPAPEAVSGPATLKAPIVPWLVCLDARTGGMLWKREVGWLPFTFFDLARGSAPLTVDRGNLYVCTNMGTIACCTAHDGVLRWINAYPIACQHQNPLMVNRSREGSSPLLVGDKVIVAPRDHTGVMAFNRDTGALLWEAILVPSTRLVGVADGVVVAADSRSLVGLDLAGGNRRWLVPLPPGGGGEGIVGKEVVAVRGGLARRLAIGTGQVVEEVSLGVAPGVDVLVAADGTLVHVVPPALAPEPGPSTVGRPLAFPLKKVFHVACEAPRVSPRSSPDGGFAMAFASGRRLGLLESRPHWQVGWERVLDRRPQMVSLVDDHVVTSHLWDVTSRKRADGAIRWTTRTPVITAACGGDGKSLHVTGPTVNGHSPFLAGLDGDSGTVLWSRALNNDFKFAGPIFALSFDRRGDGTPLVRAMVTIRAGDVGNRVGEVFIHGQTGATAGSRVITPSDQWPWGHFTIDQGGVGWINSNDRKAHAVGWDGGPDLAAGMQFDFDPQVKHRWHHMRMGIHVAADSTIYARLLGEVVHFEPASGRQTLYDLKKPDKDAMQPFVFATRRFGDRLVVVSGETGQEATERDRRSPAATGPADWKMFVDVFDHATGRRIERQQLPDVKCCVDIIAYRIMAGYDTQVVILDHAIVVCDTSGIHVFAGPAAS